MISSAPERESVVSSMSGRPSRSQSRSAWPGRFSNFRIATTRFAATAGSGSPHGSLFQNAAAPIAIVSKPARSNQRRSEWPDWGGDDWVGVDWGGGDWGGVDRDGAGGA